MKYVFAPLAAAALFAASTVAQTLTVNTPVAVECEPLMITWSGGTPPYFLSILPGNQPSAAALLNFPSTTSTSQLWIVNVTANTQLGLDLRDNTGTVAQSGAFTVQAGTDSSCLTSSGSSSSSSSGSSSTSSSGTVVGTSTPATTPVTTPATTPATKPATTPATTSTTPATPKSSSTSSAPSTSTTPKSAAVSAHTLNIGLATAMGAALFALVMV